MPRNLPRPSGSWGRACVPILDKLVERGLHNELTGEAYAVIDGVDGRVHHLRFRDIEATGDTPAGGIVETRVWTSKDGKGQRLALTGRSDLSLDAQIKANGATWIDRLALAKTRQPLSHGRFGTEVRNALEQRTDYLVGQGLAIRKDGRVTFTRDLLKTLRERELDAAAARPETETGLTHRKSAEGTCVSGTYRRRLDLASGRFAMLDTGMGFELVPWKPQLEKHLGRSVAGTITPGGGIDWRLTRTRGLSL